MLLTDGDGQLCLSTLAGHFGIPEQGAMRLVLNSLLHTWLWEQAKSCSAVLEINHDILLFWSIFYTLYIHVFLNIVPVIK